MLRRKNQKMDENRGVGKIENQTAKWSGMEKYMTEKIFCLLLKQA